VSVAVISFDPVRDKRYAKTKLGRDVVDFLAFKELGGAAERTLDQYERDLARGCLMFPDKGVADISDGDLLHIAKQFKAGERRVRVAAWRSFFKWAVGTRRITQNPTDALPFIKRTPQRVYDLFTRAECSDLCSLPIRDGALMRLMVDTGARKGDCIQARLRSFVPEAAEDAPYGRIIFRAGKGGKDRQVPATRELAQALSDLATLEGLNPSDYLWYTRPGGGSKIARAKPIAASRFVVWWKRCLADAGVRYRNPHMMRHTFATNYLRERRGRLETLQLVLGHESIQTTSDLYGHLDMRDVAYDMGLIETVE
jgi:integrase